MYLQNVQVIEVPAVEVMENRMRRVVQLVDVAEAMGFPLNGVHDENELLKNMQSVELELLSDFISKQNGNFAEDDIMHSQLQLEKFHIISCKLLDTLNLK